MNYLRYWAIRLKLPKIDGVLAFGLGVYVAQVVSALDGLVRGDLVQAITGLVTAAFTITMAYRYMRRNRPNRRLGKPVPPTDVRLMMRDGSTSILSKSVPPNTVIRVFFEQPVQDDE